MADEIPRSRRWRRRVRPVWRATKWAAAVILLIAVVVIVWVNVAGEAARRDVLAEMEARGLATQLPVPPSRSNTTGAESDGTRFALAALALSNLPDDQTQGVPILSSSEGPPRGAAVPHEMAKRLAMFAQDAAAFRRMLERVRQHDHFDYDLRWWEFGALSHLGELRRAARCIQVLALHEQAAGRPDEALALYEKMAHLNRSFEDESWLLMTLVRVSVSALLVEATEDALSRTTPDDEAIASLRAAIADGFASIDLNRGIELEMAQLAHQLRDLDLYMAEQVYIARSYAATVRKWRGWGYGLDAMAPAVAMPTGWEWLEDSTGPHLMEPRVRVAEVVYLICPGYWKRWIARRLHQTLNLYERFQKVRGDPRQVAVLGAKEIDGERDPIRGLRAALRMNVQWRTSMEVALTALAVERFRLAHDRWPDDLQELDRQVPIDGYAGAPLRYRRLDNAVVVYSVGKDGEDDGGEQDGIVVRDADIAFRLYDPAVRGTLPMPDE